MLPRFSFRIRNFSLVLLTMALTGAQVAHASSLSVFKGKYGGVLLVSQGTVNVPANADTVVKASSKSAKFTVKGTFSGAAYVYTITLANGQATVSALFPGGTGTVFGRSATGTYRAHGKTVTITFSNPGGYVGTGRMTIGFTNGNATLLINGVVSLQGADTVYSTIIGG